MLARDDLQGAPQCDEIISEEAFLLLYNSAFKKIFMQHSEYDSMKIDPVIKTQF